MRTIFVEKKAFNVKSSGAFDDLKLCPNGMKPLSNYQEKPINPLTRRNVGGEKQFGIGSDVFFFYDIETETMPVFFLYSRKDLLEYMETAKYEYMNPSQEYCNKKFLPYMFSKKLQDLEKLEEFVKIHFFVNIYTDSKYLGFNSKKDRKKYYDFTKCLLASNTQIRQNVYTQIVFYKYRDIFTQRTYFYIKPIFMKYYNNQELSSFLNEELNNYKGDNIKQL